MSNNIPTLPDLWSIFEIHFYFPEAQKVLNIEFALKSEVIDTKLGKMAVFAV